MGFQENPQNVISRKIAATSIAERLFVTKGAATGYAVLAGAGELVIGVTLGTTNAAEEDVAVAQGGTVLLTVDGNAGAISIGSKLISNASGQGVASTTANAEQGAIADAASTSAGDVIPVYVTPMRQIANS